MTQTTMIMSYPNVPPVLNSFEHSQMLEHKQELGKQGQMENVFTSARIKVNTVTNINKIVAESKPYTSSDIYCICVHKFG